MTWLGIDLGDARVGLALSDPELTLAHPIGNIQVYGDSFRALDDVIDTIEDEHIDRVIVGLPLLLDGTEGKSAKKARRWASNLANRIERLMADGQIELETVPEIELVDERLTTVSAHRQLHDANIAGRKHRPVVDQQSAVVILQSALDRSEH
ncbi:Holliday junction resolvase [Bifidobacterium sp. UTCIF-37]|uniref:Holliday junction resolvase RuvX n=1 Tax=unclassified Bifidobacterium TaxID=2608897 RepID=UPI001125BFA4|nr:MULTISPECIES: Holliday junction resolvase RuvX [unclassified Bifidobacterium]TPF86383.1 Holliday junction resolvase [Bifidobacterium sp. UTCIF-37]TPF88843.1 Holliday junction resolvase [Bifidobacterium sp. UTCIF-38]